MPKIGNRLTPSSWRPTTKIEIWRRDTYMSCAEIESQPGDNLRHIQRNALALAVTDSSLRYVGPFRLAVVGEGWGGSGYVCGTDCMLCIHCPAPFGHAR